VRTITHPLPQPFIPNEIHSTPVSTSEAL